MEKNQIRRPFLDIMTNKNLGRYLQQTNRVKMICRICVKPPTALFSKYTVLFWKKNENLKEKSFKETTKTLP